MAHPKAPHQRQDFVTPASTFAAYRHTLRSFGLKRSKFLQQGGPLGLLKAAENMRNLATKGETAGN